MRNVNTIENFQHDIAEYSATLHSDLSIIETRRQFTEETINHLEAGSDDLTLADQDEVGAELIASLTRQAIQMETFSFAASSPSIVNLFSGDADGGLSPFSV